VDYFLAFAALGFLIVVHEGGHYFVARWCKMRIDRFSIGFGPGILKRQSKKTGTTFQIAPILFGGFVEIRGMNIAEDVDPEDVHAYPNRPAWQRFITIFAGPATNYLSAIVLAFALYTCHGADVGHWYKVAEVKADYDAAGKLQTGDLILEVDHVAVFHDTGPQLIDQINKGNGAPVTLTVERAGQRIEQVISPKHETDQDGKPTWRIGVLPDLVATTVSVSLLDATRNALTFPVRQTKAIASGLYGIVFRNEKADPGGPTRIVKEFHRAFSEGLPAGIGLMMVLSVYLGLFNLFPLPALDGGRLVFLGYELVTRRRANPKIEAMVHMAGIMVLGVLMILVTLHDFHVL
jgi:regulator of sigma E protease